MKSISQKSIVNEARSWCGTRFKHQGRRKHSTNDIGGVDCLGLLIGVADTLQLHGRDGYVLSKHDEVHYSKIPNGVRLQTVLSKLLIPIAKEDINIADILLFTLDHNPQHLGIVSDYEAGGLGIIHAYAPARSVVEHVLNNYWQQHILQAFRLPHLEKV